MSVSGGSSGSSSQTQTHIDTFLNGLNLFGKTYTDAKYAAIFRAATEEGITLPEKTVKKIERARKKNYADTALYKLYHIEKNIRKGTVGPAKPAEVQRTMHEIETLLREAGWKDFNDDSYPSTKSATVKRLQQARIGWHHGAEKAYMEVLNKADAACYSVKDIEGRAAIVRGHAKATKTFTEAKKRDIEKAFAKACARCCASRLNRLETAPFIARMNAQELQKEEWAIKNLYAASSFDSTSRLGKMSIDEAIQLAHRKGIGETLNPEKLEEMPLEDKIHFADRIAAAKLDPENEKIIMAALSQATIMFGRMGGKPAMKKPPQDVPCRNELAAVCASLRMAQAPTQLRQ